MENLVALDDKTRGVSVAGAAQRRDSVSNVIELANKETLKTATLKYLPFSSIETTKSVIDWNASEGEGRARKPSFMMSANSAAQR